MFSDGCCGKLLREPLPLMFLPLEESGPCYAAGRSSSFISLVIRIAKKVDSKIKLITSIFRPVSHFHFWFFVSL